MPLMGSVCESQEFVNAVSQHSFCFPTPDTSHVCYFPLWLIPLFSINALPLVDWFMENIS